MELTIDLMRCFKILCLFNLAIVICALTCFIFKEKKINFFAIIVTIVLFVLPFIYICLN